jgi:undecaprenyl-diphosphatase
MLMGLSRKAASEFSFFMAIPTMLGASLLKTVKFFLCGASVSVNEWMILAAGCVAAFLTSMLVIRFLLDFVKRHSFFAFGLYRIILGAVVLVYFLFVG